MTEPLPLEELNEKAIDLLCRELGIANTLRFIHQYSQGSGDFTAERELRNKEFTPELYLSELDKLRKRRT